MARRGERPPIGLTWIVSWPLSAAFAALVFLSAEEIQHPSREVAPPPPVTIGGADWNRRFPQRIAAVDAALHHATALRLPDPIEEPRGSGPLRWTHRLYEITLPQADAGEAESAIEAVRGTDPGLAVSAENTSSGTDVLLGLDGLLISTLRFRWTVGTPPTPTPPPTPRLAVVIGPLGDDLRIARQVVAIDAPIAVGVRPFRPFSREVAELAQMFHHDALIELDGSERRESNAGEGGGPTPGSDLDAMLASVPHAVGIVWQRAGGKGRKPERAFLEQIAQYHLLWVSPADGGEPATALPLATVLDGAQPDTLGAQLTDVTERARRDGTAVVIGAADEAVLSALVQALPQWQAGQVDVVSVAALAPSLALSAR